MRKNEPLKCARTIWQVLAVMVFLFCAAKSVSAENSEIINFDVWGNCVGSTYDGGGGCNNCYPYFLAPNCEFSVGVSAQFSSYTNRRAEMLYYSVRDRDWVNSSTTIMAYYLGPNKTTDNFYAIGATVSTTSISILDTPDYFLTSPDKLSRISDDYYLELAEGMYYSGWRSFTLNTAGKQFMQDNIGKKILFTIFSGYDQNKEYIPYIPGTATAYDYYYEGYPITDQAPHIIVEDIFATSTQGNINFNNSSCCADQACTVPITFDNFLNGSTLNWSIDPLICNSLGDGDYSVKLDSWNKYPASIEVPPQSEGIHTLCAWNSGGVADKSLYNVQLNFYNGTSSEYCLPILFETPEFCTDEYLNCGDWNLVDTVWSNLYCGLKQAGCWFVVPASSSVSWVKETAVKIQNKFPFSAYFDLINSMQSGLGGMTDDRSGTFGLPMYSAASGTYYMVEVLNASSTEKAIGKANATTFRKTQAYFIWLFASLYILFRLAPKK